MRLALHLFYCIEGGLFLALVPWSPLWDQIIFFREFPWLGVIGRHAVVRGITSGVGMALLLEGAWDLANIIRGLLRRVPPPRGES